MTTLGDIYRRMDRLTRQEEESVRLRAVDIDVADPSIRWVEALSKALDEFEQAEIIVIVEEAIESNTKEE